MNVIDLTTREVVNITLPTMFFGLPKVRSNGDFYSASYGQSISAAAVGYAEGKVMEMYHNTGGAIDRAGMSTYFRQQINSYMQSYGGSAGLSPGSNINVTNFGTATYPWPVLGCP